MDIDFLIVIVLLCLYQNTVAEAGGHQEFSLWCNASSFTDSSLPDGESFEWLAIGRQSGTKELEMLAIYEPLNQENKTLITNVPIGRRWEFDIGGGASDSNRDTIWLSMVIKDVVCKDASHYRCLVKVPGNENLFLAKHVQLHALPMGVTKINDMTMNPSHNSSFGTSLVKIGDRLTLECTYTGMLSLTTRWEITNGGRNVTDFQEYPPILYEDNQGCPVHSHRSTYSLVVDPSDINTTYLCYAMNGSSVEGVARMTFLTHLNPPTSGLSQQTIGNNDSFTVVCDASAFRNTDVSATSSFNSIGIVRRLPNETEELLAMYRPFNPDGQQIEKHVPEGREWEFNYTGGIGDFNTDTINVIMTVNDARCDDAGNYTCVVKVSQEDQLFHAPPFVLRPKVDEYERDYRACIRLMRTTETTTTETTELKEGKSRGNGEAKLGSVGGITQTEKVIVENVSEKVTFEMKSTVTDTARAFLETTKLGTDETKQSKIKMNDGSTMRLFVKQAPGKKHGLWPYLLAAGFLVLLILMIIGLLRMNLKKPKI